MFHIPLRRIKILSEFKIPNTVNQIVVKIALEAYCLIPMKAKDEKRSKHKECAKLAYY